MCKFIKCFTSNFLYLGCLVLLHFLKTELLCIVINYVNSESRQIIVALSMGGASSGFADFAAP